MTTPGQLNRRAQLYEQLGSMLAAGVPLIQTLEMSSRNASLRSSRKTIQALIGHLKEGHTFADSMTRVQGWLPEFDVTLLSVGEESGRLDASFKLLGRNYATRAQIIRATISRLITTILTLHVFLIIFPLGLLVAFFQGIFNDQYLQCIPFLIEKIIVFGGIYALVSFLIFSSGSRRGESWRALMESIFQKIPLLGTALRYLALARLASALDALMNAGVNIVKSWQLASAASGSPRLKREIAELAPQLEIGLTPADMVNQLDYFPEMFANLYRTGEISGQIDDTLGRLHHYYEDEGFRILQVFTRIMNGTVYGLLVLLVGYNIIKFYVGYFNAALTTF